MSKIEKSDSWASWLERLQDFIVTHKIFSGGTLMVFVSSIFSPITSVIGLCLTIVLFTGFGAATFLIVSLLWKEFYDNREVRKEEAISDIKLNCDRAKEVDGILIRATNSKPVEQIQLYNQAMILIRDFPEIKKQRTIEVARKICGENVTQEQQSTIYTLLEKYEPFRDKVNELLATKGLEAIKKGRLSKQSVEFLSSITDGDLEILKKQFKYVLQLPHQSKKLDLASKDLAIWHFESMNDLTVQDFLLEEKGLMHLESYHIKFYGDIWIGENDRASSHTPQKEQENIDDIDAKGMNILQINIKNTKPKQEELEESELEMINPNLDPKTTIVFSAYVCLSEVGAEIFNLLKDELDPPPSKYLNELITYWNRSNPHFDFKLISEPNLITNNNT